MSGIFYHYLVMEDVKQRYRRAAVVVFAFEASVLLYLVGSLGVAYPYLRSGGIAQERTDSTFASRHV